MFLPQLHAKSCRDTPEATRLYPRQCWCVVILHILSFSIIFCFERVNHSNKAKKHPAEYYSGVLKAAKLPNVQLHPTSQCARFFSQHVSDNLSSSCHSNRYCFQTDYSRGVLLSTKSNSVPDNQLVVFLNGSALGVLLRHNSGEHVSHTLLLNEEPHLARIYRFFVGEKGSQTTDGIFCGWSGEGRKFCYTSTGNGNKTVCLLNIKGLGRYKAVQLQTICHPQFL